MPYADRRSSRARSYRCSAADRRPSAASTCISDAQRRFVQRVGQQRELQRRLGLREAPLGPGPVAEPDEDLAVQRVQLLARTSHPGLVPIVRQQLALVRRVGRPQPGQVAAAQRRLRLRTEPRRVDVDEPARPEDDDLVPELQQAVGTLAGQRSPGRVQGLVQVVRGCRRREVGPEQVEQILAVQPLRRVEREQLDHRPRLGQPPSRCVDRTTADLDAESPEQLHAHVFAPAQHSCRPGRGPGCRPGPWGTGGVSRRRSPRAPAVRRARPRS